MEQFTWHNVDVAEATANIKVYCERYYGPQPRCTLTTTNDLFTYIKQLPYHNFLNLQILMRLANFSRIEYLSGLIEEYKRTYFGKKLFELFVGRSIMQIQVKIPPDTFIINSCKSNTVLKEDITLNDLGDFTVEYTNQILYLFAGIAIPHCILKGSICIEWLIPSCLADYAYHSACLNTELFSQLNIVSITIGKYQIKPVEGSVGSECTYACMYVCSCNTIISCTWVCTVCTSFI